MRHLYWQTNRKVQMLASQMFFHLYLPLLYKAHNCQDKEFRTTDHCTHTFQFHSGDHTHAGLNMLHSLVSESSGHAVTPDCSYESAAFNSLVQVSTQPCVQRQQHGDRGLCHRRATGTTRPVPEREARRRREEQPSYPPSRRRRRRCAVGGLSHPCAARKLPETSRDGGFQRPGTATLGVWEPANGGAGWDVPCQELVCGGGGRLIWNCPSGK